MSPRKQITSHLLCQTSSQEWTVKRKRNTGMFKVKSKYSFYILPAPSKGSGMSESHHSKRGALKQLTLVHTHSCPYAPHMCTKDQNRCYVTGLLEYTHFIYKLSTQTGEM
ncbi:unnamed protein product [Ixodes pacificus]